jgi:FAD-linked sulfhydryl oxidase
MAKFPDKPTKEDSQALKSFVHLFARLYPCGECARHFQQILQKYPPQASSRNSAAGWACRVHNEVNKSLKKDLFNCSKIGDFYDCGCADDEEGDGKDKDGDGKDKDGFNQLELEKEGKF